MSDQEDIQSSTRDPPKDNRVYRTREYWESRFAAEDAYEWLAGYEVVQPLVESVLRSGMKTSNGNDENQALQNETDESTNEAPVEVLLVGCGNSSFSHEVAKAGGENRKVTSIDFSETVIANMKEKHPELNWLTMDMRYLDGFEDASFDFVVDKAAMDALVTDEGDPWNPNERTRNDTASMMKAVARVLKPGGTFVQITFQQPHFRKRYLENELLTSPEITEIDHGMGYFFITQTRKV